MSQCNTQKMTSLLLDIDATFLKREFYGQTVTDYIWFAGIVLGTLLLKRPIANLLTWASGRLASRLSYLRFKTEIRGMLLKPVERLTQVVLFYVALNQIADALDLVVIYHSISKHGKTIVKLGDVVEQGMMFLFILFFIQVVTHLIDFIYFIRFHKAQGEKDMSRLQLLPLFRDLSKMGAWLVGTFWVLGSVFHVNVPALITGLGIGGVAIALAGKETLESIFAAFTILSDKPFKVGEDIKVGDLEGTVERIGFRTTRLRAFDGSEYVIPNQKLVTQQVINQTNRSVQVVKLLFAIRYDTAPAQLEHLIRVLSEAVAEYPMVERKPDIYVDAQKFEFIQIRVDAKFPFPLPDHKDIVVVKRDLQLLLYNQIVQYAHPGGSVHLTDFSN